jgi:hypothetical protein
VHLLYSNFESSSKERVLLQKHCLLRAGPLSGVQLKEVYAGCGMNAGIRPTIPGKTLGTRIELSIHDRANQSPMQVIDGKGSGALTRQSESELCGSTERIRMILSHPELIARCTKRYVGWGIRPAEPSGPARGVTFGDRKGGHVR